MIQLGSDLSVHVLVVGDAMLDRYQYGRATTVSMEASVPVLRVESTEDRLGGAANVALNIASLGARCTFVSAVGDDDEGRVIAELLHAAGIETDLVVVDDWTTTCKQRFMSQHRQMLRTDFESPLAPEVSADIAERAEKYLPKADAMIIEDYDKGAIHEPLELIHRAKAHDVPVIADPKFKPFAQYRGTTLLKPNHDELGRALGDWPSESELAVRVRDLMERAQIESLIVTRGSHGLTLFEADGAYRHVPAEQVDVYDATGAGDTVAATLGVTIALGWPHEQCAWAANAAGGIVCAKAGTAAVTAPELNAVLAASEHARNHGSVTTMQLLDAVKDARQAGEKIVFTNGCFDILHAGHVRCLAEAREFGDRLIVAVNDDDSVRSLKGSGRPINRLESRMLVLAGLQMVDWVVAFSEDTPEALIEAVCPDVLVKGGDYKAEDIVGGDFVRKHGGEVRVVSLVEGYSTSAIIAASSKADATEDAQGGAANQDAGRAEHS